MNQIAFQLPLPLAGDSEATLEQFVASPALLGQLRAVAVGQVADHVWLTGAPGLGRSHVLMALCAAASAAQRRSGYLAADDLLAAGAGCLAGLDGLDLVCVDDMHRLLDGCWQEAWFHRVNRWREQRCQMVFSSREALHSLALQLPDLESRLRGMTELRLPRPDSGQLGQILSLRASARGIVLGEGVLDYLLRREQRSAGSLLALLDDLAQSSRAARRRLTVPFVREFFHSGGRS